ARPHHPGVAAGAGGSDHRMMGRRRFLLTSLAGVFAAPLATEAQPVRLPLVVILEPGSAAAPSLPGFFKKALEQLGWVEGRTIRFETRYCEFQAERMSAMARDLVALKPDVFYTHSDRAVLEAMRATTAIPIVAGASTDLLALGVIKSLARPGGNVTGVTLAMPELDRKRLEILKEAVPSVSRITFLFSASAIPETQTLRLNEAAALLKVQLQRVGASKPDEIEPAFNAMAK